MLNLYEILEVSEKASKEVIEKAYRVLAKKYHPDLQEGKDKQNAEKKMKQINEAYETLGDEEKRKQYDIELGQEREEQKRREQIELQNEQIRIQQENMARYNEQEIQQKREQSEHASIRQKQEYDNMKKLQNEMNRAYSQAYNDYWRSMRI